MITQREDVAASGQSRMAATGQILLATHTAQDATTPAGKPTCRPPNDATDAGCSTGFVNQVWPQRAHVVWPHAKVA
jgi:hypothetical protein